MSKTYKKDIGYLKRLMKAQKPTKAQAAVKYVISHEKGAPLQRIHKQGRNEPCPCGSGKKYKNCHLFNEEQKLIQK